jgi:hypothetical protein
VAQLPSEGRVPDLARLFPEEGLTRDSVRLSAADTFGLADFNNVFTGEYTFKDGYASAFLAERDTPEQAAKDARRYQEFLIAHGYQKDSGSGRAGRR